MVSCSQTWACITDVFAPLASPKALNAGVFNSYVFEVQTIHIVCTLGRKILTGKLLWYAAVWLWFFSILYLTSHIQYKLQWVASVGMYLYALTNIFFTRNPLKRKFLDLILFVLPYYKHTCPISMKRTVYILIINTKYKRYPFPNLISETTWIDWYICTLREQRSYDQ